MNTLAIITLGILFLVNLAISWHNAKVTGRLWAEAQAAGGWARFLVWCGAIMAACGFTDCYTIILSFIAHGLGYLPDKYLDLTFKLEYALTILPVLGTGLVIWANSLVNAWKERTLAHLGAAAWNTYAQLHNTYSAVRDLPGVIDDLFKGFSGKNSEGGDWGSSDSDSGGKWLFLAVLIVLFALLAGVLTTVAIIKIEAGKQAQILQEQINKAGAQENAPA